MEEIDEEGRNGIFVRNKDNTFSPLITDVPGYAGDTTESSYDRYLWFTDNNTDISSLIPVVTPSTPLVAIYNSTSDMPERWYLERYEDKKYTIGAHIYLDEDLTMYIDTDEPLSGTSAEHALNQIDGSDDAYEISSISGKEGVALPIDNVDNNMSILLGTSKDKMFTFTFYRGTKEETVEIYADTRIFQSVKYTELTTPYKKTSKGYFIINLPVNLQDGYYYLSDIGFFRYQGNHAGSTSAGEDSSAVTDKDADADEEDSDGNDATDDDTDAGM